MPSRKKYGCQAFTVLFLLVLLLRSAKGGQLVAGSYHTCAILNDDTVKCWGSGGGLAGGKLGYGDTNDRGDEANEMGNNLPVVDLGSGKTAKQLVAGEHHTCAILNDDTVKCWGYGGGTIDGLRFALGGSGQLGYGDTNNRGDEGCSLERT